MEHIKPSLLFRAAERRAELDLTAQEHLMNCKNCIGVITVFKAYLVADEDRDSEDNMSTAANTPAPDLPHVSEVLEVAQTILQRHRDEHLGKKTLIMQGFLEMSQRYPERDYRASVDRALAELTGAVHLHLNAELHAVTTLFARLGETTAGQIGVTHIEPQATQESARSSASV